jgi:hypothetical protein
MALFFSYWWDYFFNKRPILPEYMDYSDEEEQCESGEI